VKLFAFLFLFLFIFFIYEFTKNEYFEAEVISIIDGDTIEIKHNTEFSKLRIFGIDAPELDQEFGQESRTFLKGLLQGKKVKVFYKDKDKYGRILALIRYENNDIGKMMVEKGYAWAYVYYSEIYVKEQIKAKEQDLGLWANQNAIEPYKWRKKEGA